MPILWKKSDSEMNIEVIAEDVAGPVWADAGDVIRVLEGVTVDGTGTQGIGPRTGSDIGFRVAVHGTVIGDYYGVDLQSDPASEARNSLFISSTGRVTGIAPVYAGNGSGNIVVNWGLIDGRFGIVGDGPATMIANHGVIRSEMAAIELTGDASIIRNHGLVEAGIYLGNSVGSRIFNTGTFESQLGGITVVECSDFGLINQGQLIDHSEEGYALELVMLQGFRIGNSGTLSGDTGIQIYHSDGILRNSGAISGSDLGIHVGGFENEVVVRNEGIISGGVAAVFAYDVTLRLNNSGTIEGHIIIHEASYDSRILNSGHITGDVEFGYGNDRYFALGSAEVGGKIVGGYGNDVITGGMAGDRLFGDMGDDDLNGRLGADVLTGGSGDDVLKGGNGWDVLDGGDDNDVIDGGAGNDMLTGGAGLDVFVFGAESGKDRVTDFEQGIDLLRIAGHTGGFGTLAISVQNAHLTVAHDGGTIVLEGLAATILSASDFEFL